MNIAVANLIDAAWAIVAYNNDPGNCMCKGCRIIRTLRNAIADASHPIPRAAVLGDIVEPWVWAYKGHAMPNGTIYADVGVPVWRSNSMEWHGV